MTKVLFLLSAVVMVVAGFFTYQNRDTFIKLRLERTDPVTGTETKLKGEMKKLDSLADEIVAVKGKVNAVNTELTTENERLAQAKIKLRNAESDADSSQKNLEANQAKIAEFKDKLKDLPQGVSLETINEDINKMKQDIATSEGEGTKVQEQVTAKEGDLKKAQGQLGDIIERIEARKKLFDRNSLTATIVAVNNDWGFVIIDGGQNKGITVDTKLLITRGQQTIGRLNIVNVEGNKTVANIDQKSLRSGLAVAPGDHVILEALYQ